MLTIFKEVNLTNVELKTQNFAFMFPTGDYKAVGSSFNENDELMVTMTSLLSVSTLKNPQSA